MQIQQNMSAVFSNNAYWIYVRYIVYWYHQEKEGGTQMDKKIGKLIKVVRALTQLALEVGTLIAVIKMVIESIN